METNWKAITGKTEIEMVGQCDDLKVLKVGNWKKLAMDRKFGMTCLRKPKPTKGCSANGRRRRS
jgi:hypothetical protein